MLKKTIKYSDFNGNHREEDHYFNFTRAELTEMELSVEGGLSALLKEIQNSGSARRIMDAFKEIIGKAYGIKTEDGRRFQKSDEITRDFFQSLAYDALFYELLTDAGYAAQFVQGLMPADVLNEAQAQQPQDKPLPPAFGTPGPVLSQDQPYPQQAPSPYNTPGYVQRPPHEGNQG